MRSPLLGGTCERVPDCTTAEQSGLPPDTQALAIARRFPEDERAAELRSSCNLGIAHIGTIIWVATASSSRDVGAPPDTAHILSAHAMDSQHMSGKPASSRRPGCETPLQPDTTARQTARQTARTLRQSEQEVTAQQATQREAAVKDADVATVEVAAAAVEAVQVPARLRTLQGQIGGGLSIKEAEALRSKMRARSKSATELRASKDRYKVWGPLGSTGIPPEELKNNRGLHNSWGPKPADVFRDCKKREGCVTKRHRADRDRLARTGGQVGLWLKSNVVKPAAPWDGQQRIPLDVARHHYGQAVGVPSHKGFQQQAPPAALHNTYVRASLEKAKQLEPQRKLWREMEAGMPLRPPPPRRPLPWDGKPVGHFGEMHTKRWFGNKATLVGTGQVKAAFGTRTGDLTRTEIRQSTTPFERRGGAA